MGSALGFNLCMGYALGFNLCMSSALGFNLCMGSALGLNLCMSYALGFNFCMGSAWDSSWHGDEKQRRVPLLPPLPPAPTRSPRVYFAMRPPFSAHSSSLPLPLLQDFTPLTKAMAKASNKQCLTVTDQELEAMGVMGVRLPHAKVSHSSPSVQFVNSYKTAHVVPGSSVQQECALYKSLLA